MASVGSAAERSTSPPPWVVESGLPSVYKVEFWGLGGLGSPDAVPGEWHFVEAGWAAQWDDIPAMALEWEALGGRWVRAQLRVEEHQRFEDGRYWPANRL